jgi:hypothetical protein
MFQVTKPYKHALILGMAVRALNHGEEVGVARHFPCPDVLTVRNVR